MKQRFTALDVRCVATELRHRCVGMRLVNVYDVNAKTYILKFARNDEKIFVLIESGTRMHTTEFFRDKNNIPSGFAMKLRKHIRTRRLMDVRQLGMDRVVQFDFSGAEGGYHLFVEFYASGNVILTDHQYSIMSLLRVVQPNEETRIAVKENYDISQASATPPAITEEKLREVLQATPKEILKKVLTSGLEYGPVMMEHAILLAGLKPTDSNQLDPDKFQGLLKALSQMDQIIEKSATEIQPGFIFCQPLSAKTGVASADPEAIVFDEFWSFLPQQLSTKPTQTFPSFDKAVDEFFSRMESQKADVKAAQQEAQAMKKIQHIHDDHNKRVEALIEAQLTNVQKAELIEANLQRVDDAIMVIRSALANAMSWKDLKELVKEQKARGNPVASIIDRLKLETNQISLVLSEAAEPEYDDSDESDSERPPPPQELRKHQVDVDLSLSAYANARQYYDQKRSNAIKQEKTLAASQKAMKSAERKVLNEMQQVKVTSSITRLRKPFWFEKFLWFISSENYVVIAGRDMQQNELLVKRYMRKGDIYVHADIHGASSVIVKNPTGAPVPPSTLAQAGSMAVCLSSAWDSRVVISAYWVEHHQVSKTAPTGEFLTTGSFMIRGKKNYLPPVTLVLGFGILFKLDEASVPNHLHERRVRTENDQDAASSKYELESLSSAAIADEADEEITGDDIDDAVADEAEKRAMQIQAEEDEAQRNLELYSNAVATDPPQDNQEVQQHEENDQDQTTEEAEVEEDVDEEQEEEKDHETSEEIVKENETETQEIEKEEEIAFPDTNAEPAVVRGLIPKPASRTPTETESNDNQDDESNKPAAGQQKVHRYRTAAEKRQTKKAREQTINKGKAKASLEDDDHDEDGHETAPPPSRVSTKPQKAPAADQKPAPQTQAPRGKKGKIKKMKEKYADQDEEDRAVIMELLQPAKKPPPPTPSKKHQGGKQQQPQPPKKGLNQPKQPKQKPAPQGENTGSEEQTALHDDEEDIEKALNAEGLAKAERDELKRIMAEEKITLLEEEELNQLSELDSLTGNPLPHDVLLFAVPVCAPYNSLNGYKYRIKVTPGTQRKGKAAKTALSQFMRAQEITPREKDLLKAIPEMELIQQMKASVKLSAPNLEKSKQQSKKKK